MEKSKIKNIIGEVKTNKKGYNYMSLYSFPPAEGFVLNGNLLAKANEAQVLLGKLSGITELLPDVNFFISSYITKDATNSSQIEGTRATVIDAFEYAISPTYKDTTDADDIYNYIKALNYGLKRIKQDNFPFTLRFIKELHDELMKDARATHFSDPGNFRKSQNWINGKSPIDAEYVPPTEDEMIENLNDLEKFIHTDYYHPIIQAGLLHSQFETIHPFLDGNGRTGRLLITFYLLNKGLLEKPVLFLSTYFKRHQKLYYLRLNEYHSGDYLPWIEFFLDGIIDTAKEAILLSEQITKLREKDLEKISAIKTKDFDLNVKVLQHIYASPIISSNQITEITQLTKQGALKYLKKLTDIGILEIFKESEGVNPTLYIHKKYANLFK